MSETPAPATRAEIEEVKAAIVQLAINQAELAKALTRFARKAQMAAAGPVGARREASVVGAAPRYEWPLRDLEHAAKQAQWELTELAGRIGRIADAPALTPTVEEEEE
ncbi:MAG TPA: hypothetical protein VGN96_03910 [Roseococcus sp.]|jgi:hypothetical protein|nr:hypothetical protein [Roseococcus sp.]